MKVKIKKDGKKETFNLIESWSDVNLETWLKIIDLETGSKTKEAEETIAALSDIPKKLIKELSIRDVAIIMNKIAELQSKGDTVLKKIVEIEGIEYGMHPNLDDITIGEYADIESLVKDGFEKNMPEIMAVLFRPVVEKKNEAYVIEAYGGDITIRAEAMKQMSAEQVQNVLVFFWSLGKVFWNLLPSSLIQRSEEMMKECQAKVSQNDGDGSESSTDSAIKI